MKKLFKNWEFSYEQYIGKISCVYEFIKQEINELQEKTECPDTFIYDFLGRIQNEWHPESCHLLAKNHKRTY